MARDVSPRASLSKKRQSSAKRNSSSPKRPKSSSLKRKSSAKTSKHSSRSRSSSASTGRSRSSRSRSPTRKRSSSPRKSSASKRSSGTKMRSKRSSRSPSATLSRKSSRNSTPARQRNSRVRSISRSNSRSRSPSKFPPGNKSNSILVTRDRNSSTIRGKGKGRKERNESDPYFVDFVEVDITPIIKKWTSAKPVRSAKQVDSQKKKLMDELANAHQTMANSLLLIREKFLADTYALFEKETFTPLLKEMKYFSTAVKQTKADAHKRVLEARKIARDTLEGVNDLLKSLHNEGVYLIESHDLLKASIPFLDTEIASDLQASEVMTAVSSSSKTILKPEVHKSMPAETLALLGMGEKKEMVEGSVLPEIRNQDSWMTPSHDRVTLPSKAEREEIRTISNFFGQALRELDEPLKYSDESVDEEAEKSPPIGDAHSELRSEEGTIEPQHEPSVRGAPLAHTSDRQADMNASSTTNPNVFVSSQTSDNPPPCSYVLNIQHDISTLSAALVSLFSRLKRQHDQQKLLLSLQKTELDEGATKRKMAEDVLKGTIERHNVEASTAMTRCQNLHADILSRMDKIEHEAHDALEKLLSSSAEICIANGARNNPEQQKLNSETSVYQYMSKMEANCVAQAKVLREVQDELLRLWRGCYRESTESVRGREARETFLHQSIPHFHARMLESCDRDMLIRLLYHISLKNEEAQRILVACLEEYMHFLSEDSDEATASCERIETEQSIRLLIAKLEEEGRMGVSLIQRNRGLAPADQPTTAEIIEDMVYKYNELMEYSEKKRRRAERKAFQKEMTNSENTRPAFFDKGFSIPGSGPSQTEKPHPDTPPAQLSSSHHAVNALQGSNPSKKPTLISALPHTFGTDRHGKFDLSSVTHSCMLSKLDRAHPSVQSYPTAAHRSIGIVASAMGHGRWGGKFPRPPPASVEESLKSELGATFPDGSIVSPSLSNLPKSASANLSPLEASLSPLPPPRVPVRTELVKHVLNPNTYSQETYKSFTQRLIINDKVFGGSE